jgi:hypothetical protein
MAITRPTNGSGPPLWNRQSSRRRIGSLAPASLETTTAPYSAAPGSAAALPSAGWGSAAPKKAYVRLASDMGEVSRVTAALADGGSARCLWGSQRAQTGSATGYHTLRAREGCKVCTVRSPG